MFIENRTPYKGKVKLKFEKEPWYRGKSVFNKVHLNLGFTQLVSRVYPFKTKDGYDMLDSEKIKLINENTGGLIGVHEWWECVSKRTGRIKKKYTKPDEDIWEVVFEGKLPESFVSQRDNIYIGDIELAWWYYKHELSVYQDYPQGVALKLDDFGKIEAVYGYSPDGGVMFEIGDKIFDEEFGDEETPYDQHGTELIETWEEAIESAMNLSEYLKNKHK